jgi:hypothetical protein
MNDVIDTPAPAADDERWARPVARLSVSDVPSGAINLNVQGRQLTGPLQGFGQLWQKTYAVRLAGARVTPREVIATWKKRFGEFWPPGNHFYSSLAGITPGDVAVLNLGLPGGVLLSTGVLVIYADDESFAFMTPRGHIFCAMITFSAEDDDGVTVVRVQALVRANDPLIELGCRLGITMWLEDRFWTRTLQALAAHFGVEGQVQQQVVQVDPRVQWREAANVWYNAAIRSGLWLLASPFRHLLSG